MVWEDTIIDGHNRYGICQRHKLKFDTVEHPFDSRSDAKIWIIRNQLGRRNLSDFQRGEMALVLKPLIAEKAKRNMSLAGGDKKSDAYKSPIPNLGKPGESFRTDKEVARAAGVSHGTINKVEKILETATPEVIDAARKNDISIDAAATIAELPVEEQREIVRAAAPILHLSHLQYTTVRKL